VTRSPCAPPGLGDGLPGLITCTRCPRLVAYRESLPPKAGRSRGDYWARPVPGFGDPGARICLVGMAPGAHGANRTGRPFTGDGAGDFMYPLLHEAGLASQGEAVSLRDGLTLRDLYITNAVKCVPPENKPLNEEYAHCLPYLEQELTALSRLKVVLLLGQGAFQSYLRMLKARGVIRRLGEAPFGHAAEYRFADGLTVVASYHTSRYNVQTGRITADMFRALLQRVCGLATQEKP